ncbi:MAG: 4-hydroxy-tetrahydrodipicolinate reductase [Taibaiella sp.]|nr:4-hydroxy-tetrahydrodipicolinate reductase [Taibaiella sp.]
MKIALIGYGKMGHAIEQAALKRGHSIVLRINSANRHELNAASLEAADVVIEFTGPETARTNVLACLAAGKKVVCGSTGWNEELQEVTATAKERQGTFLYASNFSIGVNIFFEVNKLLATLINGHGAYEPQIEETHHLQKKDAPSGTAITLAEQILERLQTKKTWSLNFLNNADILPVLAHRTEDVPGTHKVKYISEIDSIEIIHTAHNRDGFALGAVLAAEFLESRQGVFTMRDVLFS